MQTHPSQQKLEQYYFEKFRKQYRLPAGNVEYTDRPDVIIQGEKKTGIEITNFYLMPGSDPNSEQRQEKLRKEIINKSHRLYLKNGGKNIELSFAFNPIQNRKGLAQKIAALPSTIEQQESGPVSPEIFRHIPEVTFIYINSHEYKKPKWQLTQVYSTPFMQKEALLNIVKEKEKKAENYEPCDCYWLLIVIDFANRAQDQEIIGIPPMIQSTQFEKIIIYRTAVEEIIELPMS